MSQNIKLLVELQKIDGELLDLQRRIKETPLRVSSVEKPLLDAKVEQELRKKRSEDFQKKKKVREQQLDDISEKISKLKDRTSDIKTNKEYQAHLREIEQIEKERYAVEDDILVLMEKADELEKEVRAAEEVVREEQKKIDEYKKELDAEVSDLEASMGEFKAKRNEVASGIDEEMYREYMKKLENGQGLAVVEVRDSVCMGCNMNIPPQLYVEVRKGEEIFTCPQCRRFLFFQHEQTEGNNS